MNIYHLNKYSLRIRVEKSDSKVSRNFGDDLNSTRF